MAKKKIIITLSKVFPANHSKAGKPTFFKEQLLNELRNYHKTRIVKNKTETAITGRKKHTIRANYDRWAHNIAKINEGRFYLSLREWSGKPYASKQEEIEQLHGTIGLQRIELKYHAENNTITAKIDGREWLDADCYELAKNDGLSVEDFKEWFFGKNPKCDITVTGAIIHFTDFRY